MRTFSKLPSLSAVISILALEDLEVFKGLINY